MIYMLSKSRKMAVIVVGAIAVLTCVLLFDPASLGTRPPRPDPIPFREHDRWLPKLRNGEAVEFRAADPDHVGRSQIEPGTLRVEPLGRLPPSQERRLESNLRKVVSGYHEKLRQVAGEDPFTMEDLLEEARLRLEAEKRRLCIGLLREGRYVTVPVNSKVPTPENHDYVAWGTFFTADGERAQAYFFLDRSRPGYSDFLRAYSETRSAVIEDVAMRFNSLPLSERKRRFEADAKARAQIGELRRNSDLKKKDKAKKIKELEKHLLDGRLERNARRYRYVIPK